MKNSSAKALKWLDAEGPTIAVEIPEGGVAVAWIPLQLVNGDTVAHAKIATLEANEAILASNDTSCNWLRASLQASQSELKSGAEIRLLGEAKIIADLTWLCERSGIRVGRAVPLEAPYPPVQFLPEGGRIRIPREISLAEPITRVLIVDDSKTIRELLARVIGQDPRLLCVGAVDLPSAADAAIAKLRPDVITLDIHMPEMNGVELLKKLMPKYRLPTIMISSLSMEEGTLVLDALELGAVDYIQKPSASELSVIAPLICEKICLAASARVRTEPARTVSVPPRRMSLGVVDLSRLLVIGSSTGGTEALTQVLTALPSEIPPILIVQHIPAVFSKAFADRMNSLCPFEVKEAADGDEVLTNRVLIAPGGKQMHVKEFSTGQLRVVVDDSAPVNRHKPSVDVLFNSAALIKKTKIGAAILTGMGADGAKGLLALKKIGASTIAQDEATCVVYGMPKEAVKLGAADHILPLSEIAMALIHPIPAKPSR